MRIFVISQRVPYPPNKGERIRSYHQLEYLARQGYEITLFTITDSPSDVQNLSLLGEKLGIRTCSVQMRFRRLHMLRSLLLDESLSVGNFYSRKLQKCIDESLSMNMPDCVMCTSSALAPYVFKSNITRASDQSRPWLVMDFMDLDSAKWAQYAQKCGFLMSMLYRREARLVSDIERSVCEAFNLAMFVSDSEAALMIESQEHLAQKIHVVGNGVDIKSFKPSSSDDASPATSNRVVELLFSGVMDYRPNEEAVLWFMENCWSDVLEKFPDARFTVAGMNPSRKIRALEKVRGVEVTGFVHDILPYFHRATVFVAPFQIARGLQNKILESFACGLPVITSTMGADGISGQHGEHLLLAESPSDYVSNVFKLTEDRALYARLAGNALDLIESSYSWDSKNALLVSLLEDGKDSGPARMVC